MRFAIEFLYLILTVHGVLFQILRRKAAGVICLWMETGGLQGGCYLCLDQEPDNVCEGTGLYTYLLPEKFGLFGGNLVTF